MIDFNTSQLTWLVIGACSVGGGGYMTMTDKVNGVDTKVQVMTQKVVDTNDRIAELAKQLERIENKLDKKGSR